MRRPACASSAVISSNSDMCLSGVRGLFAEHAAEMQHRAHEVVSEQRRKPAFPGVLLLHFLRARGDLAQRALGPPPWPSTARGRSSQNRESSSSTAVRRSPGCSAASSRGSASSSATAGGTVCAGATPSRTTASRSAGLYLQGPVPDPPRDGGDVVAGVRAVSRRGPAPAGYGAGPRRARRAWRSPEDVGGAPESGGEGAVGHPGTRGTTGRSRPRPPGPGDTRSTSRMMASQAASLGRACPWRRRRGWPRRRRSPRPH